MNDYIVCPSCLENELNGLGYCNWCSNSFEVSKGIPISITDSTGKDIDDVADELASLLEMKTVREAIDSFLSRYDSVEVLDEVFKTRTESWRTLVNEKITGKCLDLNAGFGKRSLLLAELVDTVHSVDTSLPKLRVLSRLSGYENKQDSVFPLCSEINSLPYPANSFDTIVGRFTRTELERSMPTIVDLMTDEGVFIAECNGWPREARITNLIGLESVRFQKDTSLFAPFKSNPYKFSKLFSSYGFEEVDRFALLSSPRHRNEICYKVDDEPVVQWALHGNTKGDDVPTLAWARRFAMFADKLGVLKQCYPGYLFVLGGLQKGTENNGEILFAGKNRSTKLRIQDSEVTKAVKTPNSRRQKTANKNEIQTSEALSSGGKFADTIPKGEKIVSRLGIEWHEEPVEGTPLKQHMGSFSDSFETNAKTAIDWLIILQNEYKRELERLDEESVRDDLSVPAMDLYPPSELVSEIYIFETPVHGDYFGTNIYIDSGNVVNVIDWEWSSLSGNPVVDPGFFLLQYVERTGDDFQDGFSKTFLDETGHSVDVKELIDYYCTSVGLSKDAFLTYLAYPYIRRIKLDRELNYYLDVNWPERVEFIWEHSDELFERF